MKSFEYLVVGAGPAGGAAATEFARHCAPGAVGLVGDEPYVPYERPPLSKATLAKGLGDAPGPGALFGSREGLEAQGVQVMTATRVSRIDRHDKCVEFDTGGRARYGKLLIATGAAARRIRVPGADLSGVCYLRTYDDARKLSGLFRRGARLVVIGGGFIGLEVAATASLAGVSVCVVEAAPRLMARSMPDAISKRFREKFEANGVSVRLNIGIVSIEGVTDVESVLLDTGERLPADIVVVGIGSIPNDLIASEAGLEVNSGILTDRHGQSSDPSIYAVGDVARRVQGLKTHPAYAARLEAWEPAIDQAQATAISMLGLAAPAAKAPWLWSDQFDWNLQVAGHGDLADEVVVRADERSDVVTVFQLHARRLVGLITLNSPRDMVLGRRVLQSDRVLDIERLADTSVPVQAALKSL